MISFLLFNAGFLNLLFYIFAIGFLISLGLEQWLKFRPLTVDESMNERNMCISYRATEDTVGDRHG